MGIDVGIERDLKVGAGAGGRARQRRGQLSKIPLRLLRGRRPGDKLLRGVGRDLHIR